MAKGNMFLGRAKGKVGSVVFSVVEGEQITRAKAASISNPRTFSQNVQRAVFSTVAKAASLMRPIVDHSYAGIAYDVPSLRHFRKINLDKLRNAYIAGNNVNLSFKGGAAVPNEFIVSQGNLPTLPLSTSLGIRNTYNVVVGEHFPKANVTAPAATFSEFKKMLPGVQAGDQITVLRWYLVAGSITDGTASFSFDYDRVVLADNLTDAGYMINEDGFTDASINLALSTSRQVLVASTYESASGFQQGIELQAAQSAGDDLYAIAVILSRKVGGSWQRSTQSLYLTNASRTDLSSAVSSYSKNTESLDGAVEYLNNADNLDNAASNNMEGSYLSVETFEGGLRDVTSIISAGESSKETLETAAGNSIKATANAAADERVVSVEIYGNNADGTYLQVGKGNQRTKSLVFEFGEDGNFVGTYTITALFAKVGDFAEHRKAVLDFTLSAPSND